MNEREQRITKAVLGFLDQLDGGQAVESLMHAESQTALRNAGQPGPSLAEFDQVLRHCDREGWIIGVPAKVTRQMKWCLSDAGRAALTEL
jgi:hypothetical protein